MGCVAYGIEPDPNAQILAKILNLKVYQGFITDNPFPNIKFDYLTASQVIEHDPNPNEFMKAAYNKLQDQGYLILSFPNFDSPGRKIFGRKWLHWHVPYHVNYFSRKSFRLLVENSGFRIVKACTITPNLWTILQIKMLFIKTREGQSNPLWTANKDGKKLSQLFLLLQYILITPFNRIIDILGQGESYLFILRKK